MQISYPSKRTLSEFEIQATLYNKLKLLRYDVRGEVTIKIRGAKKGFRQCRFDLIVFNLDKQPICIIEVKNNGKIPSRDGRQFLKYSAFGLPLLYCVDLKNIDYVIYLIEMLYE